MKKKTKPTPEPGFNQQINTSTGEALREICLVVPMYSVMIRSSHSRDTLANMRKMGISVIRELKHD